MSKTVRPSKRCPECATEVLAGRWHAGTMTRQPNGKRKLTERGRWVGTCKQCKLTLEM